MAHLNFVREGRGPLVVLSHALGCDLSMWDGVSMELAKNFEVIRFDHRNHGKSERVGGHWDMRSLAADAALLIEEQANGRQVHLVGLSMGGMMAQALALSHPELLASVTIANSCAFYPDKGPWHARMHTVQKMGISESADGAVSKWLTPKYVLTIEGAVAAEKLRRTRISNDAQSYIAACEAVANIDFRVANHQIATPALVIGGTLDEATPLAMSQEIESSIPGSTLVTIDAAHLSAVEQPARFCSLLRSFWNSRT